MIMLTFWQAGQLCKLVRINGPGLSKVILYTDLEAESDKSDD
jgi:hypothetical protein